MADNDRRSRPQAQPVLTRREREEAQFRLDQFHGRVDADAEPPEYEDWDKPLPPLGEKP